MCETGKGRSCDDDEAALIEFSHTRPRDAECDALCGVHSMLLVVPDRGRAIGKIDEQISAVDPLQLVTVVPQHRRL